MQVDVDVWWCLMMFDNDDRIWREMQELCGLLCWTSLQGAGHADSRGLPQVRPVMSLHSIYERKIHRIIKDNFIDRFNTSNIWELSLFSPFFAFDLRFQKPWKTNKNLQKPSSGVFPNTGGRFQVLCPNLGRFARSWSRPWQQEMRR